MINKLTSILILMLLVGCSTSKSEYIYTAKNNDPHLEFSSDFGNKTKPPVHFSLNIIDPDSNKCEDFKEIGYYYPESSIFIFAEANPELSAKVPANKYVSIESHYNIGNAEYCYAETLQFLAEEAKNYNVIFKIKNDICNLEIIDNENLKPVRVKPKRKCIR